MALGIWMAALAMAGAAMEERMDERSELLAKAMKSVREAIPAAEKDPNRPAFHFRPPALWMNDPNGTIYHDGWYHVFYQHNPYGDGWGHMHWGHARSRDLVNWEHLPIALWPSEAKGEEYVFSGSTFVDKAGQAKIFYTSISGRRAPEQWIATPMDKEWIEWTKPEASAVLTTKTHLPTNIQEWRDPFLFNEGGKTLMVVGGRLNGKGIVALYSAKNAELTDWAYKGILFTHPDADLIECPNLAKIGGKWVLLTSSHGKVESFVGTLDPEKPAFVAQKRGVLGEGSYASQLLTDKEGRTIHTAWVRFEGNKGWNGCLSLPNVLSLSPDGTLLARPVETLESLRG
ncbi:glycoside hydrolase family 32 protein, partial [bacterium]